MSTHQLKALFKPRSVALAGASARAGSLGRAVLDNLRRAGFAGPIHLINPRHALIDDAPCFASVADLPQTPDLLVVAAPREAVAALVEQAAARGVQAAIVITADPSHGEGSLASQLREIAARTGIRVVGPNCLGVLSPVGGLDASFSAYPARKGDLAVISQSGAVAAALTAFAAGRGIGFSGLVSIGDMADVDFAALLDWFALDGATRAILLYVESIRDAKGFMSAARAASRVKPVIVIKAGRNPRAAKAAATHTGAMAGSDAVYDAAFRRAGLLRVRDINELFEAAEALGRVAPFPGDRLAILTNGGGIGVLAVDDLIDLGGKLAELSPATLATLDAILPATWSRANPVDIVGDADAERFSAALAPLLADSMNDAVMVLHCPTALSDGVAVAQAVADTARAATALRRKPLFAVWLGASPQSDRIFEAARIPHYQTGAMAGFMHLVTWGRNREALMATPPNLPEGFSPDVERARQIIAGVLARGDVWLDPIEATALFEAYAIPIAQAILARTPQEAALVAGPLLAQHGRCVVKIRSRDIQHKSDVGGVVLDLASPQAVQEAAAAMLARVARLAPQARIAGVTVHPMIRRPEGRELIVGLAEDPTFGPVVLFGRGGKAVEVINDRALALPPLDLGLALDLISRTRVSHLLREYRDVPAADLDEIALTLVKLAQMSADLPEIRELDINPLLADGEGVIAMDARVRVAPVEGRRGPVNPRFAVAPYPKQWERWLTGADGRRVFVRPVRPEDEAMYRTFFAQVSPEDLRLRFFAPVKDISHAFIARLTQIDYARALALCATLENGEMLGAVRLMLDPDHESGEFAILLRSDQKGRGLGSALMKMMIDYGLREGVKHIEGQVLAENTTMLAMCQQLGFEIRDDQDGAGAKEVRLDLRKLRPA